jgi:cytochrome c peroxidase
MRCPHFNKIIFLCFISVIISVLAFTKLKTEKLLIPKGWPQPVYDFKNNPITKEGFELGRELFYDPILSSDSTISCASCHLSYTSFAHTDHRLSHGINGLIGTRNSPALMNLAWNRSFMWDGGVNNLEAQPINPITSKIEMNSSLEEVVKKLNSSHKYRRAFYKVYNDSNINTQRIFRSMALFTGNLISCNSKYDSVMRKEKNVKFTAAEQNGYVLFKKHCNSCHAEPLFTNNGFENNGLAMDTALKDLGRMKISMQSKDSLKFKVPTLRNIEYSFPYMHDGRFKRLQEVLKHYNSGIQKSKTLSKQLQEPIVLSPNERVDIIAFLLTLSDKSFIYNENYAFPKKPTN